MEGSDKIVMEPLIVSEGVDIYLVEVEKENIPIRTDSTNKNMEYRRTSRDAEVWHMYIGK